MIGTNIFIFIFIFIIIIIFIFIMIYNGRQFKQNPNFPLANSSKSLGFWLCLISQKKSTYPKPGTKNCKKRCFQVLWLDLLLWGAKNSGWFHAQSPKGTDLILGRVPLANSHLWGWEAPDVIAIHPATLAFWHVVFLFKWCTSIRQETAWHQLL